MSGGAHRSEVQDASVPVALHEAAIENERCRERSFLAEQSADAEAADRLHWCHALAGRHLSLPQGRDAFTCLLPATEAIDHLV